MTISYNLTNAYDTVIIDGIKERKPANRDCRVYLVLTIGRGQQKRLKTDFSVNAKVWDFAKQQIKPQANNSVMINKRLADLRSSVLDAYTKLMDSEVKPTFDELVDKLGHVVKTGTLPTPPPERIPLTLFQSFDKYIDFKLENGTYRTVQKVNTLLRALQEYEKKAGEPLTFDAINLSFYRSFSSFLHTRVNIMTGKTGYRSDTVAKYMEGIKAFMKWSHEEGHHNNADYTKKGFSSARAARHEIVALTQQEVKLLIDHDFSNQPNLDRIRDLFVFMIHTGQRWGDIHAFEPKEVKDGVWDFHAQKTTKRTIIPLVGFAKPAADVLKKYDGNLPKMTAKNLNEGIKKVGKLANITEEVTIIRKVKNKKVKITKPKYEFMSSHMARRTLVTILADRGVELTTIQEITQHEDLKTLMKYKDRHGAQSAIKAAFEKLAEPEQTGRTLKVG